jgi:hypothetical protein
VATLVLNDFEEANFSRVPWENEQLRNLASALRMCPKLKSVSLLHSLPLAEVGVVVVAGQFCADENDGWLH